jgi:hypothetical protein
LKLVIYSIKKPLFSGFFIHGEDYFFASAAGAAGAAAGAAGAVAGASAAGAAAGAAGAASTGFASSFLPQAAKAIANIATSASDFFICNFLLIIIINNRLLMLGMHRVSP